MKALLFDEKDLAYLQNALFEADLGNIIVRLKEMKPNKNTLRIIKEDKLNSINLTSSSFSSLKCPDCNGKGKVYDDSYGQDIDCDKCKGKGILVRKG